MGLFERMKAERLELDEDTYRVVVNCLCKAAKLDKVVEWFECCKGNGVVVNAVYYSNLVDKAERLFAEMVEMGFMPDLY